MKKLMIAITVIMLAGMLILSACGTAAPTKHRTRPRPTAKHIPLPPLLSNHTRPAQRRRRAIPPHVAPTQAPYPILR
jgi:hypothetical protein